MRDVALLIRTADYADGNSGGAVRVNTSSEVESTLLTVTADQKRLDELGSVTVKGAGSQALLSFGGRARIAREAARSPTVSPESRAYFRSISQKANKAAEQLLLAANTEDAVGAANSASELDECLGLMWAARKSRDDERLLGSLITPLQAYVRMAIKQESQILDEFACNAIWQYVTELLGTREKSKEDLLRGVQLLKDAGHDPFHLIS